MLPTGFEPVSEARKDRGLLVERSPRTYIDSIQCPPRSSGGATTRASPKRESKDLVDHLQGIGEDVEFLVFEDEGRDVLKFTNHARGHNAIVDLSGST